MKKQKKLNNKGFSMVELVIVIAIMAVLVSVLAPQYIKYVEQSRVSTDETNAAEILKTVQVLVADATIDDNCTVTWSGDQTGTVVCDPAEFTAKVNTALSGDIPAVQSREHKDGSYVVSVVYDADNNVSVTGTWNS